MKYTLDTNLYIAAFRDPIEHARLARFEFGHAPMLHLTSIVAHELRADARVTKTASRLDRNILSPFEKRSRIASPSYEGWKMAGQVRAALAIRGRAAITASFLNDIMLAVTCRENGFVLVTYNTADFAEIRSVLPRFSFVEPFP